VLHHLLSDLQNKLLIPIQSGDEIKTMVFSLNMHNVFEGDGFLGNLFSEVLEACATWC